MWQIRETPAIRPSITTTNPQLREGDRVLFIPPYNEAGKRREIHPTHQETPPGPWVVASIAMIRQRYSEEQAWAQADKDKQEGRGTVFALYEYYMALPTIGWVTTLTYKGITWNDVPEGYLQKI